MVLFLCIFIACLTRNSRSYAVIPPPRNSEEKALLDAMLRVDHAGEYGANRIYAGQMAVLGRTQSGQLIQASYYTVVPLVLITSASMYIHYSFI